MLQRVRVVANWVVDGLLVAGLPFGYFVRGAVFVLLLVQPRCFCDWGDSMRFHIEMQGW